MNSFGARWRVISSDDVALHATSSGVVRTVPGLYSAAVFGSLENLRCQCGELQGPKWIGANCPRCGVTVESDSVEGRRTRVGYVELAVHVPHRLAPDELIEVFPIAPISWRVDPDGAPNRLGQKYERLIAVNAELAQQAPPKDRRGYLQEWAHFDTEPLTQAMDDLLGIRDGGVRLEEVDDGCLLGVFFGALIRFDPATYALARACGLGISFTAEF